MPALVASKDSSTSSSSSTTTGNVKPLPSTDKQTAISEWISEAGKTFVSKYLYPAFRKNLEQDIKTALFNVALIYNDLMGDLDIVFGKYQNKLSDLASKFSLAMKNFFYYTPLFYTNPQYYREGKPASNPWIRNLYNLWRLSVQVAYQLSPLAVPVYYAFFYGGPYVYSLYQDVAVKKKKLKHPEQYFMFPSVVSSSIWQASVGFARSPEYQKLSVEGTIGYVYGIHELWNTYMRPIESYGYNLAYIVSEALYNYYNRNQNEEEKKTTTAKIGQAKS